MSTTMHERKPKRRAKSVTALTSWYGSNRMLAERVGAELHGCDHVTVLFAGSMTEVAHICARTLNINDKHAHLINLARVTADLKLGPKLYRALRRKLFHPDELRAAQDRCAQYEAAFANEDGAALFQEHVKRASEPPMLEWAIDYFVCAWMARHSTAGQRNEFASTISTRWNAGGGDSAAHFQGAVRSLIQWRRLLSRANFTALDWRAVLDKVKDELEIGLYADPPFPGPGDLYKHRFTFDDQHELAQRLSRYTRTRIVCRFYDHELVRKLYRPPKWKWIEQQGRTQTNDAAREVLLINGDALTI